MSFSRLSRMRFSAVALGLAIAFMGVQSHAADTSTTSTTSGGVRGMFEKILPSLPGGVQEKVGQAESVNAEAHGLWDRANDWLEEHIGVSLREVIHGIVSAVIWILGFAIQILDAIVRFFEVVLRWTD